FALSGSRHSHVLVRRSADQSLLPDLVNGGADWPPASCKVKISSRTDDCLSGRGPALCLCASLESSSPTSLGNARRSGDRPLLRVVDLCADSNIARRCFTGIC